MSVLGYCSSAFQKLSIYITCSKCSTSPSQRVVHWATPNKLPRHDIPHLLNWGHVWCLYNPGVCEKFRTSRDAHNAVKAHICNVFCTLNNTWMNSPVTMCIIAKFIITLASQSTFATICIFRAIVSTFATPKSLPLVQLLLYIDSAAAFNCYQWLGKVYNQSYSSSPILW